MSSQKETFEKFSAPTDGNVLLVDTCFGKVSVGMVSEGKFLGELSSKEGAMESLFELISAISEKFSIPLEAVDGFGLCDGVGSVLGIRVASAALSTMAMVSNRERPVFSWQLFDAAAAYASSVCNDYVVGVPSRKGYVNALWAKGTERGESELDFESFAQKFSGKDLRKFYINQRPMSGGGMSFVSEAENMDLSLESIWTYVLSGKISLYRRRVPPDAALLSKREYVKWNSQARI